MDHHRWVVAAALLVAGIPSADGRELDDAKSTCRAFPVSGQDNMAALVSWLRGYHARPGTQDAGPGLMYRILPLSVR